MTGHDFEPLSGRCVHCGTRKVFHDTVPSGTPCPQQGTRAEPLRPEPVRRQYASEDFNVIYRELRRNRVVDMCVSGGLVAPCDIPYEIFLAAGFSPAEVDSLPSATRRWPILETELR